MVSHPQRGVKAFFVQEKGEPQTRQHDLTQPSSPAYNGTHNQTTQKR